MQTVVAHDGLLSLGLKLLGLKPIDVDNMHVTTISAFASTQLATSCLVAQGPVCIVEFPDLAQRLASRLMKRFWQTFDHVAGLMVRRTTLLKASAPSTIKPADLRDQARAR